MRLSRTSSLSGSVDGVGGLAPLEDCGEVGSRSVAHRDAGRSRGAADVGGEDDVAEPQVARMDARLAFEYVQARARDAPGLERLHQRRVVDDAAARGVHE